MNNAAVAVARYSLTALAIVASPFFGLWALCGHLADKRGQRLAREGTGKWKQAEMTAAANDVALKAASLVESIKAWDAALTREGQ